MTKIAIICDSHQGIRNDNTIFLDYLTRCYEWFFSVLEKQNIRDVIHLGDVYDRRKYVNFLTAHRLRKDFLEPLSTKKINSTFITGNHDVFYKNTDHVNALDELIGDRYEGIKVHKTPQLLNFDGTLIQLIPWILESNREAAYDAIKNTKAEILMGHFEIKGFELLKGIKSDHGDDVELFNRFDLVFSGHFHHRSVQDNIHYLGAFAEYTWSDFNDPRGITIFDTSTRKFSFVRNPNVMFNMIAYDDVKYKNIIELIQERDYSKFKNTYVRIVSVNRTNPYAFEMLLDKLYKVGPADISIIEDSVLLTENSENSDDSTIEASQDTSTLLDSYIDNLTLPVDSVKMKNYMKDVYKEALSV